MPYIITTSRAVEVPGSTSWDESTVSRAVATLDEARQHVHGVRIGLDDPGVMDTVRDIPASGGTVGPLPDGTIIDVELVTPRRLVDELRHAMLPTPAHWHLRGADAEEVAAVYNAAHTDRKEASA